MRTEGSGNRDLDRGDRADVAEWCADTCDAAENGERHQGFGTWLGLALKGIWSADEGQGEVPTRPTPGPIWKNGAP